MNADGILIVDSFENLFPIRLRKILHHKWHECKHYWSEILMKNDLILRGDVFPKDAYIEYASLYLFILDLVLPSPVKGNHCSK